MTNRFMISVAAAALIAGTGFANAQGPGRDAPAAGSAAQQSAPAERAAPSAAPMNRDAGESKGMKGAQTDEKMAPGASKNLRAQDDAKPGMKSEKSAQDTMKGEKSKSMSSETQDKGAASKDMKADSKGATDSKSQTTTQAPAGKDSKSQTTTQAPAGKDAQTTGNAATSATAAPPPEKRTQIVSAIKSADVPEVSNVNFNISVGVAVPSSIRAYPLPPRIVEIYPEWRGYEVIRVRGQWVIVRPQTRTIVYIIEG